MSDFPNNDAYLTDVGPWPSAGEDPDNDRDWQERFERELQADFPDFDVVFERRVRPGNQIRLWASQCHSCGSEILADGPIRLRNALHRHVAEKRRTA